MSINSANNFVVNLSELNSFCLEEIFSKLNINDLANISDVCSRFQYEAAGIFSRKFKKKKMLLCNHMREETSQILKVFGSILQKVHIVMFDYNKTDFLFDTIIEKCSLNLIEFDFSCTSTCTSQSVLSKAILSRFQSLRCLKLDIHVKVKPTCIENKFPHLQHLSLDCGSFKNVNLQNFIILNPQLKSLELTNHPNGIQINRKLLGFINEMLPKLEHFAVNFGRGSIFPILPYESLFLHNLKSLHIKDSLGRHEIFPHLAICNKNIEEIKLTVNIFDQELVDLMCQYRNLRKINFDCIDGMSVINLGKITELPKLLVVRLSGYYNDLYNGLKHKLNVIEWDVVYRRYGDLEIRKKKLY